MGFGDMFKGTRGLVIDDSLVLKNLFSEDPESELVDSISDGTKPKNNEPKAKLRYIPNDLTLQDVLQDSDSAVDDGSDALTNITVDSYNLLCSEGPGAFMASVASPSMATESMPAPHMAPQSTATTSGASSDSPKPSGKKDKAMQKLKSAPERSEAETH